MRKLLVAALAAVISPLALAASARADQPLGQGRFDTDGNVVLPGVGAVFSRVPSLGALKAVPLPLARVRRDGFSTPGDGGAADYTWSASNCANPDDGAQVQPASRTGCWHVDHSSPNADVRLWGAKAGQDIAAPLRAAIAWACRTHKPLVLPYSYGTGAQYLLGSQITIGDGTNTSYSTCNNVGLELVAAYPVSTSGTTPAKGMPIRYTGPADGSIPFVVNGPVTAIRLKGLGVDCAGLCATGIKFDTAVDGKFEDLTVEGNRGPAFVLTAKWGNVFFSSLEGSRFDNIHGDFPCAGGYGDANNAMCGGVGGGSGMQLGDVECPSGSSCGLGVLGNVFTNMTFNYDGKSAAAYGLRFGMASQNTLINVRTTPYFVQGQTPGTAGNAIKISPPPGSKNWPNDNTFIHPLIAGAVDPGPSTATWTPPGGGFHFISWSNSYQPFPSATTYGMFTGSDSKGGIGPGVANWTPTDTSGAGLPLIVQDAQFAKVGKVCTVILALTYPTTASTAVASLGNLPCAAQAGSLTSRAGGAPSYTDYGSPMSLLVGAGLSTASFYTPAGAALTNSQLSGKTVRATLTFITD